jgi:protoheme IX farnesyltransferase
VVGSESGRDGHSAPAGTGVGRYSTRALPLAAQIRTASTRLRLGARAARSGHELGCFVAPSLRRFVASFGAVSVYLELAKVRLCLLVLLTTLVGYILAGGEPGLDPIRLGWTLLGTALAAFGANALNQCIEVDRDSRMQRTRGRPLPSRRLSRPAAWTFALAAAGLGPLLLWTQVAVLPAALAALCLLMYVLLYTPLKPRTPLNTLVGALVGAIPPLVGWTAASGQLAAGGWILAAVLFFWQIPHFLALAWMYRDDYARGGFRMLPVVDASGRLTCRVILLYTLVLLPLGLSATLVGLAGPISAAGSVMLGAGLLWLALRLHGQRTAVNARRVFLASIIYLPLLLGLLVTDRPAGADRQAAEPGNPVAAVAAPAAPEGWDPPAREARP